MNKNELEQLRVLIRAIIRENEGGDSGGAGGGYDMGMPMSQGYGFFNYGGSLKNIFIDPFLDVAKTVKGVSEELATQVAGAARVAIETVLSSVIPVYQTNYKEVFSDMSKALNEAKKKYAKVYQANDDAFKDKDIRFLAFLYDPSAWITAKSIEMSPASLAQIFDVFAAGASGTGGHLAEAIRYLNEIQQEVQGTPRYSRHTPHMLRQRAKTLTKQGASLTASTMRSLERLMELDAPDPNQQQAQQQEETVEQKIEKILKDPNIRKEIAASPMARQMKADAQSILNDFSTRVSADINSVNSLSSLEDLNKVAQGKMPTDQFNQLQPQARQQAEQATITQTKQALDKFYATSLDGAIKAAQAEGVRDDGAYIQMLSKLRAKTGQ